MMDDAVIAIRQAHEDDAEAIAQVQAHTWDTTYPGLLPKHAIAAQHHPRHVDTWRRVLQSDEGRLVLVAEIEGEIIGFASSGPNRDKTSRFTGETYALYVLEAWQSYGLGRALLTAGHDLLADNGHTRAMVWVLVGNPAAGFYEQLGGLTIAERDSVVGGEKVRERAYGWWLG